MNDRKPTKFAVFQKNQADAFFCSRISDSRPCLNRTLR